MKRNSRNARFFRELPVGARQWTEYSELASEQPDEGQNMYRFQRCLQVVRAGALPLKKEDIRFTSVSVLSAYIFSYIRSRVVPRLTASLDFLEALSLCTASPR